MSFVHENEENEAAESDLPNLSSLSTELDYFGESDMESIQFEDMEESQDPSLSSSEYNTEMEESQETAQHEKSYGSVGGSGDQEDKRDRYWAVKEMTFVSEEAAFVFYNAYAKEHGFSIRRDRLKRGKGPSRQIQLRKFVCSRQGKRQPQFLTMEGRRRRLRPESRCNCGAELIVNLDKKREVWFVKSFVDDHNHILARPDEVPFLWSHRKIKPYQKSMILSMISSGVRKHMVMKTMRSHVPTYRDLGFVDKDLYNMCSREKRKMLKEGDAATTLGILASRKAKDPDFFTITR